MARLSAPTVGMTLIEVMVVIAIVAVLAAMVVPVFGAIRTRHDVSVCASNLRTIGQALLMYRADYLAFPPGYGENPPADGEWWDRGKGQAGLGLAQLYYAYWAYEQRPPVDYILPPGDYLLGPRPLHCPRAALDRPDFRSWEPRAGVPYIPSPYLGGYNAYDWNYRRDRSDVWPDEGPRNLLGPFPPADTVITWCPLHRENPPAAADALGDIRGSDRDLVLFADGSVRLMASRFDQYKAERP